MRRQARPLKLELPAGGINETFPYARSPRDVTVLPGHVQNYRPFDTAEDRFRGGQRPGLRKWGNGDELGSGSPVDLVRQVTVTSGSTGQQSFTDDFNRATLGSDWTTQDDVAIVSNIVETTGNNPIMTTPEVEIATGRDCSIQAEVYRTKTVGTDGAQLWLGGASATVEYDATTPYVYFLLQDADGNTLADKTLAGTSPPAKGASKTFKFAIANNTATLTYDGNDEITGVDMTGLYGPDAPGPGSAVCSITGSVNIPATGEPWIDDVAITAEAVTLNLFKTVTVAVSGGSVYADVDTPGTLAAVAGASMDADASVVGAVEQGGKLYLVDGTNSQYYDPSDGSWNDWASDVTDGTLPGSCRMIALYRNRIVLSGKSDEPHNWFMSAVGDPLDWDYSPATTSQTQAVAGNNADAGEVGDIVTALVPFHDDVLLFGGAHSIWRLHGDPAAGGSIDLVSSQVGIFGPLATAFDPAETFYFVGNDGIYRMPIGGFPESMTHGRLHKTMQALDPTTHQGLMAWDRRRRGLWVFITSIFGTDHINLYWDARSDSWWKDEFPADMQPRSTIGLDSEVSGRRSVLLGGKDGYLRSVDDDAANDDGTAIDSYIRFPLVHPALPSGQFQLHEVRITLDADASGADLDIYRGKTPEAAAGSSTSQLNKTLAAGRNMPVRKMIRANALSVRLRNSTAGQTWAFEDGTLWLGPAGTLRASNA